MSFSSHGTRCGASSLPRSRRSWKRWLGPIAAGVAAVFFCLPAFAGGGGSTLPINTMLEKVLTWMSGSLARTLGTIALIAAGLVWMFLRHERGADFAFRALLGTAIAIGAASMLELFIGEGALL